MCFFICGSRTTPELLLVGEWIDLQSTTVKLSPGRFAGRTRDLYLGHRDAVGGLTLFDEPATRMPATFAALYRVETDMRQMVTVRAFPSTANAKSPFRVGIRSGPAVGQWTNPVGNSVEPSAPNSGHPATGYPSRRERGPCACDRHPPETAHPWCGAGRSRGQRTPASGRGPDPAVPQYPRIGSRCSNAPSTTDACAVRCVWCVPESGCAG